MDEKNRFEQRLQHLPPEIWTKVAQIDAMKGQWLAGVRLAPQVLERLKQSVLVTSTGASTRIEGAQLTNEDIERLLRGIDIQKFADRDKQEVRGYFELLANIFNSYSLLKFSENLIKHFHQEMLKYVEKDRFHRGEYKKQENKVQMIDSVGKSIGVLFDTTPAYLTPKEMFELVNWTQKSLIQKKYHPLLVVGNFLVEFLQIHPFADGNGRLSRLLTNFFLLKEGYLYLPYISHEKLIEDNKADYYLALRKSQKTFKTKAEDITSWLDFFLSIFLKQSKMALELLLKETIEKVLSHKQLLVWQYLQKVEIASPGQMAKKTKVARSTINQVLNKLLRLRRIERIGEGRSTRYRKI